MRMMQYEWRLAGLGYVVAGDDTVRPDLDWWNDDKLPEIKMDVLECCTCSDESDFMNVVDFTEVNHTPQEILAWQLIRFTVHAKGLVLEYYNKKLGQTEVVVLEKYHKLKLQFSVPRRNGNADANYLVDAVNYGGVNYHMYVIEYIGGVRRKLDFYERGEKYTYNDVVITEYADF